ncbi:MAG: hypothetical protein ABIT71_26670 [Vicinamibacteraceae bacterium]
MLTIPESVMQPLTPEDRADLSSMLGEVFEVYEIDEWGQAWVRKSWPGSHRYHSLGLDAHEMERVEAGERLPS